jgi:hypothetical protein
MKKSTRLGTILLLAGITLLVVTFFRGNSSTNAGSGSWSGLPSTRWGLHSDYLWSPRDLKIEIQASTPVDIYILDAEGIRLWKSDETLKPFWAFEKVKQETATVPIVSRGEYAILVHNPSEELAKIEVSLSFFGFEKDLFWASIAFTAAGLATIVASFVVSWRRPKTGRVNTNEKTAHA